MLIAANRCWLTLTDWLPLTALTTFWLNIPLLSSLHYSLLKKQILEFPPDWLLLKFWPLMRVKKQSAGVSFGDLGVLGLIQYIHCWEHIPSPHKHFAAQPVQHIFFKAEFVGRNLFFPQDVKLLADARTWKIHWESTWNVSQVNTFLTQSFHLEFSLLRHPRETSNLPQTNKRRLM